MGACKVFEMQIDSRECGNSRSQKGGRARQYDPEVGRFLQRDPIGFKGGQTNLYDYSFLDPVNFVDSSGLTPASDAGTAGVVVGVAVGGLVGWKYGPFIGLISGAGSGIVAATLVYGFENAIGNFNNATPGTSSSGPGFDYGYSPMDQSRSPASDSSSSDPFAPPQDTSSGGGVCPFANGGQ